MSNPIINISTDLVVGQITTIDGIWVCDKIEDFDVIEGKINENK